jgi:hypothetical protein
VLWPEQAEPEAFISCSWMRWLVGQEYTTGLAVKAAQFITIFSGVHIVGKPNAHKPAEGLILPGACKLVYSAENLYHLLAECCVTYRLLCS